MDVYTDTWAHTQRGGRGHRENEDLKAAFQQLEVPDLLRDSAEHRYMQTSGTHGASPAEAGWHRRARAVQGGCLRSNSGSSPWPAVPLGVALHLRTQLLHLYNGDKSNSAGWRATLGPAWARQAGSSGSCSYGDTITFVAVCLCVHELPYYRIRGNYRMCNHKITAGNYHA